MRVNHVGEVCAQALYEGQALTAQDGRVRDAMIQAAAEEQDHLIWCENRLKALQGRKSVLNPVWYAGAFGMGALAGWVGDRWSLGFLKTQKPEPWVDVGLIWDCLFSVIFWENRFCA